MGALRPFLLAVAGWAHRYAQADAPWRMADAEEYQYPPPPEDPCRIDNTGTGYCTVGTFEELQYAAKQTVISLQTVLRPAHPTSLVIEIDQHIEVPLDATSLEFDLADSKGSVLSVASLVITDGTVTMTANCSSEVGRAAVHRARTKANPHIPEYAPGGVTEGRGAHLDSSSAMKLQQTPTCDDARTTKALLASPIPNAVCTTGH
eukprot:scaffold2910_cov390-Prasinococcus_capsulatus_cf.AAC.60